MLKNYYLIICLFGFLSSLRAQDSVGNHQAGSGSTNQAPFPPLRIELPACPALEFCIAPLQIGNTPFATKEIWLGGRGAGGFKEPPTRCLLAGSVVLPINNQADWCLLIGKSEITVAQWHAILGTQIPDGVEGAMPMTKFSRSEVYTFLEKANEKLKSQPLDKTVKSPFKINLNDSFFRLPSEAEWEFCARGGMAVDSTTFDKPCPYDGPLNQYEWFFGQDSSKGKLKQVSLLKPNPLGLHDMLGNAAEMVESLFQIEYSQGRLGGCVIRGGDFRTEESDLRASLRVETPSAFPDGTPYRSGSVGFRLAIGTIIVSSMAEGERLENEWEKYSQVRTQPSSRRPAETSVSAAAGKDLEEISEIAKKLAGTLEIGETRKLPPKEVLQLMEVRLANIRGSMKRADERFANGAVLLSSIISADTVLNAAKLLQATNQLNDKNAPNLVKQAAMTRVRIAEGNIDRASLKMEDCLKMFAEIPLDVVQNAYAVHISTIQASKLNENDSSFKNDRDRQIAAIKIAQEITIQYINNRNIKLDKWKIGLMSIARKWVNEISEQN
jgi:hypothetical protein